MRLLRMYICSVLYLFAAIIYAADDPVWTEKQKRILASLSLSALQEPPPAYSNRVANSEAAVEFGKRLFFDMRLGAPREKSCASCHQPGNYFTDGGDKAGFRTTLRGTSTIVGSAYNTWFYADGRRDSLWAQALLPIEAAEEMGSSRVAALQLIDSDRDYRKRYELLFPEDQPAFAIVRNLPAYANPYGNQQQREAWSKVPTASRHSINAAFANVGKVLAAYQRTINPKAGRFDHFIDAILADRQEETNILNAAEKRGLALFIDEQKTRCLNCHNGPLLSNGGFHNIGTGNFEGERLDFGRVFGIPAAKMDPFNCLGAFSDAQPEDCHALRFLNTDAHVNSEGAFKVPTLRGISMTAPYMHDVSLPTLQAVVEHYRVGAQKNGRRNELIPLSLSKDDVNDLVQFLGTL